VSEFAEMSQKPASVLKGLTFGAESSMVVEFAGGGTKVLPSGYYMYDELRGNHHTFYAVDEKDMFKLMRKHKGPFRVGDTPSGIEITLLLLKGEPRFYNGQFPLLVIVDSFLPHILSCTSCAPDNFH
jgi:hypothetical protein